MALSETVALSEKIHRTWYTTLICKSKDYWINNIPDGGWSGVFLIHGKTKDYWLDQSLSQYLNCTKSTWNFIYGTYMYHKKVDD